MPVQEEELEEIDETLEITNRKDLAKNIEKAAIDSNMEFEIVEVVPRNKRNEEIDNIDYDRDRTEEDRPSYIISMRNRKRRPAQQEDGMLAQIKEADIEEEEQRRFTVVLEGGEFVGLPEEIKKQLE